MGYLEVNLFYELRKNLGNKIAMYFWNSYRRYLDDGFILWDKRLGEFDLVFDIINSMHPAVGFTMERSDDRLKYLDIIVYKDREGIKTQVYNKETDSGTFLPFDSCHPHHCKINIPFNMARRVKALTDDADIAAEKMNELSLKLENCGYPTHTINTAIKSAMQLNTLDLRIKKQKQESNDVITFVNTYNPIYPGLVGAVKSHFLKLQLSSETQEIFRKTIIISSLKEPKNLKRLFQHSKFDFSQ